MKSKTLPLLLIAAIVAFCGVNAKAAILITVTEFGIGTFNNGSGAVPLIAITSADPGPGGLPAVLTYDLGGPPSLVAGDVILRDSANGPISDLIRFNPADPARGYPASLVFYSSGVGGFDSLADTVSLPGAMYTNTVTLLEVLSGGVSHAVYVPQAGNPGFVAGQSVTYDFVSDTPEPGGFMLLAVGLGLAGVGRSLRKRGRTPSVFTAESR